MTTGSDRDFHAETPRDRTPAAARAGAPPSPLARHVMAPMSKVINPLMRRLAGRRHVPMVGRIHHTGRRSGRAYATPVGVRVLPDGRMLIPVTFGSQSDWARNVLAAGTCVVRIGGRDRPAVSPRLADAADPEIRTLVRAVYRRQQPVFRMLGVKEFLLLEPAARH